MTPRMKVLIATFQAADPEYKPPRGKKAIDSPWARWVNGMSKEVFEEYVRHEVRVLEECAIRRAQQQIRFERDLGKPKSVDLNTGRCEVVK